jgi:hypothetical protein
MVPDPDPPDLILSQIITFFALQMHFSRLLYLLRSLFSGIWCLVCVGNLVSCVCWQFGVLCVLAIWCLVCVGNLVFCVGWQFGVLCVLAISRHLHSFILKMEEAHFSEISADFF